MNTDILFSVIIPTYNRGNFIGNTIDYFLKQTYTNFELIIVDDGSTDNTAEVVKNIDDDRIKYFFKENGERGAARNYGALSATGSYLNFFDSDDIAYDNHLFQASIAVQELSHPMVFHLGMEIKDKKGAVQSRTIKSKRNKIFNASYITPNAVFVSKESFKAVKYSENRQLSGTEDWLFHLQLAARFDFIPFDGIITSCLLQHDERSMVRNSGEHVLIRGKLLNASLRDDDMFIAKYRKKLRVIDAEMLTLSALYFSLEKKNKQAFSHLKEAFFNYPQKIFTKRTLAIIRIMALSVLFK